MARTRAKPTERRGLRALEALALAAGAGVLIAQAGPRLLAEWWANPDAGHVAFVLPVGFFVLVRRFRPRDARKPMSKVSDPSDPPGRGVGGAIPASRSSRPDWASGIPFLAAGFACLFLDAVVREEMLLGLGLVLAIPGAAALLRGRAGLRSALFPTLLFVFAVPWPQTAVRHLLHMPLQRASAACTGGLLGLFGQEAQVSGSVVTLGTEALNVAEACSGLKAMTALVFLALLLGALLAPASGLGRAGLAVWGLVAAFLANVVRLVAAGAMLRAGGQGTADAFLHGSSVLVVYGAGAALVAGAAVLVRDLCARPVRARAAGKEAMP